MLAKWSRYTRTRITMSDHDITASDEAFKHYDININPGILIGYWDEEKLDAERKKRDAFLLNEREFSDR